MRLLLVQRIGHQAQKPRALDGPRQCALMAGTEMRPSARHDFHVRGHEPPQRLGVLVVKDFMLRGAEETLFLIGHNRRIF